MKALRENGLTAIFKKLTAEHSALELTYREYVNLNLLAYELLHRIKGHKRLHIPTDPTTAINYSNQKDIRAIEYCLFELTGFVQEFHPDTPISPYHVAAAMHLLNAAYLAYKNAQNTEYAPENGLLFPIDSRNQITWTLLAKNKVLNFARDICLWEQTPTLP